MKKNPGIVKYAQPKKGGSARMPKASVTQGVGPKVKKQGAPKAVAPKIKVSLLERVKAYRKRKYGV